MHTTKCFTLRNTKCKKTKKTLAVDIIHMGIDQINIFFNIELIATWLINYVYF